MVFGFSKIFVIFLIISVLIGFATKDWHNGAFLLAIYAIITIVWRILTGKRDGYNQ